MSVCKVRSQYSLLLKLSCILVKWDRPENQVDKVPLLVDKIQLELVKHMLESIPESPRIMIPPSLACNDLDPLSNNTQCAINSMDHNTEVDLLMLNQISYQTWLKVMLLLGILSTLLHP